MRKKTRNILMMSGGNVSAKFNVNEQTGPFITTVELLCPSGGRGKSAFPPRCSA